MYLFSPHPAKSTMTDDIKKNSEKGEWMENSTEKNMPSVILNLGHIMEEGKVTNITFLVRNAKEMKAMWKFE